MGLFDHIDLTSRKDVQLRALPPIPKTGWKAPQEFPNLSSAVLLSVDTETKDPELQQAGPGWGRHRGHIVGYSLAAQDRQGNRGKWYFPMRHEVDAHENLDAEQCLNFARHALGTTTPKVFANALYDLGWLDEEGVKVNGKIHDCQFAEAIIDNNAFVGLEILAQKYLGEGKQADVVEQWILDAYRPPKTHWRKDLYRAPPSLVGPYGESDADLPLRVIQHQWPIIQREDLGRIYDLEHGLLPMLIAMRKQGVSVNVPYAEKMYDDLGTDIALLYQRIEHEFGYRLVNTKGDESSHSGQVGKLLDHLGIKYPRTAPTKTKPQGSPSIEKEWLEALDHPVGEILHDIREHEKMRGTFVKSYILNKNINGKLYPLFHPLKGESNGTMVGRFSSSDPNLQNIPTRTKLGKKVRKAFIPDPGHHSWRKHDYSQIHYRILAHFAVDNGDGSADRLRAAYSDDPDMDYHLKVYRDVAPGMGWSQDYTQTLDDQGELQYNEEIQGHRRIVKNINFSGLYGVGEATVGFKYLVGMSPAQVKEFLTTYHEGAPYIKATMQAISNEAAQSGYVTTLLGRRIRFELWEQMGWPPKGQKKGPALKYQQALERYGSFIQLAYLYRAVNYKFQGSEPDIMKTGMLNCWNSGVFDYVGVPRLTVHDELDWSVVDDSPQTREAFRFIKHTMEQAVQLRIPVKVDATRGGNWGEAK